MSRGRKDKLKEIRILYQAYKRALNSEGREYLEETYKKAIDDYLTFFYINEGIKGNAHNFDLTYQKEFYNVGLNINQIINYNLNKKEIDEIRGNITVPF